jgi:hypothetical protein
MLHRVAGIRRGGLRPGEMSGLRFVDPATTALGEAFMCRRPFAAFIAVPSLALWIDVIACGRMLA